MSHPGKRFSRFWLASLALPALASCTPPARAAAGTAPSKRTVLVELFTSQGCSSCPPAEAFLGELPRLGLGRERVVPLAFHVTYWDDLGWKDPFASPAFTARQQRYADAHALAAPDGDDGLAGLYTPQMIVDGRVHFSGTRRNTALAEIARAAERPAEAELAADAVADQAGNAVSVVARVGVPAGRAPDRAPDRSWVLTVALADRAERTAVTRGENAGRTLAGAAIVRALAQAPVTTGAIKITLSKPPELAWDAVEIAAFIQAADTMRVVAARAVPLARR